MSSGIWIFLIRHHLVTESYNQKHGPPHNLLEEAGCSLTPLPPRTTVAMENIGSKLKLQLGCHWTIQKIISLNPNNSRFGTFLFKCHFFWFPSSNIRKREERKP
ncbi:hypothetical protein CIPAW_07G218100 [Carya illinoinensis]|uniref:Uncharacterized protein n=1 Tax=Carya illinoinensis TaxID=32201 RepID=A0A8T1Q4K4_CARIL|nr:hypothetical protein CIPAW_07G218100 [Carya illinoinensis]